MDKNKTRTQYGSTEAFEYRLRKKTVGKYEIVREISRGGMGIVFESWQKELSRRVAIKVLPLVSCNSDLSIESQFWRIRLANLFS